MGSEMCIRDRHVKHQQVLSKAFKRSLGKIYRPRYLTGHNDPIHSASDSFQAEDGIRDVEMSRGLGDVYKRQVQGHFVGEEWPS